MERAAAKATAEKADVEKVAAEASTEKVEVERAIAAVDTQDGVEMDTTPDTGVPRTKPPPLHASTPGRLSQPPHLTNFRC